MLSDELKNCPFCGDALIRRGPRNGGKYFEHPATNFCLLAFLGVGDPLTVFDSPSTIAAWNRRASTQDVRAVLVQAVEALEAAQERYDATGYCTLLELSCHDKVLAAISSLRSAIQGAGSGDSSTLVGETVPGVGSGGTG